jgi:hypothetical protein
MLVGAKGAKGAKGAEALGEPKGGAGRSRAPGVSA